MSTFETNKPADELKKLKNLVTLVYVLQVATFGFVVTYLIAPLVAWWLKSRAEGTWLESHLRWQLNTFWFSLAGAIVGILTLSTPFGFVTLTATSMWFVFRIGQGWTRLSRNQAIANHPGIQRA